MSVRLTGRVSLENRGGFIQMAIDVAADGSEFDAGGFDGVEIDVHGNGQAYNLHLRTADVTQPWQSYRCEFIAVEKWQRLRLPFSMFQPHRIGAALDRRRLRRLGLVAIGREFDVDLACCRVALFR
jgi:hypothetical protein